MCRFIYYRKFIWNCFAILAIRNSSTEARQLILTTTSIIVTFTVLFNGGLTKNMLHWLKIKYLPLFSLKYFCFFCFEKWLYSIEPNKKMGEMIFKSKSLLFSGFCSNMLGTILTYSKLCFLTGFV